MTPAKSPEASAMSLAIMEHGKDSAIKRDFETLKKESARFQEDVKNMQFQGGRMSFPVVQTSGSSSGGSSSAAPSLTENFSRLVDGTLESVPVYVASAGTPFGPF